jgi:predicted dehydrogenase
MDVGCYCISGLRLVAGEPVRSRGEQIVGPSGVDVVFGGALAFADGILGHFDCGFVVPRTAGLEVVGEEATIVVPDPFTPRTLGIDVLRPGAAPKRVPIQPANSFRLELENVSAAIRGEAPLLLGRDDALAQARAIEALYRSAETVVPTSDRSAA